MTQLSQSARPEMFQKLIDNVRLFEIEATRT